MVPALSSGIMQRYANPNPEGKMLESRLSTLLLPLIGLALLFGCGDAGSDSGEVGTGHARPAGCFGKCDGTNAPIYASDFELNLEAANAEWPDDSYPIKTLEDLGTMKVTLGAFTAKSATNHYGEPMYILPYADDDNVKMADGTVVARRDAEIAKAFPVGTVGIALKNHRAQYRTFGESDLQGDLKEHFKLQATHIELVVGVERDGVPGAITLNNPQTYQNGLFGDAGYRMDFFRITYPDYVDAATQDALMKNLLAHLMNFAAVSEFPGDYNGGDPLAAYNPEKILEHAIMAVRGIAGDQEALDWFQDPAHQIYCAELAFVSTSSSIHVPLTAEFMVPFVGQETWDKYLAEVAKHNAGESSAFSQLNDNDSVDYVRMDLGTVEAIGLQPLYKYAPADQQPELQRAMAFKPLTAADIVANFLGLTIPRKELGEAVAPVQGQLLEQMEPGLMESLGMDKLDAANPARVAVTQLFAAIVTVVKKSYGSYDEFQAALAPLMEQARQLTGPRPGDESGTGYYMPPSGFQVVALGRHPGGALGVRYAGTGVHYSLIQKSGGTTTEPVEPVVDVDVTVDTTMSCAAPEGGASRCTQQAPGGCYCDDQCERYEDCCDDYLAVCAE